MKRIGICYESAIFDSRWMMILYPFGYTATTRLYDDWYQKHSSSYAFKCKIECAQVDVTWRDTIVFQQLQHCKIGKMFKSEKLLKLNTLIFNVTIDNIKQKRSQWKLIMIVFILN